MLRLGELVLFLAPFAAYAIIHMIFIRGSGPSGRTLLLLILALAAFGGTLVWLGTTQGLNRNQRYVPARIGPAGEVVQGHGAHY
jgi:hypothetical protein